MIGVVLVRHASSILLLNHCWLEFVEVFVALLRNHWPLHELRQLRNVPPRIIR